MTTASYSHLHLIYPRSLHSHTSHTSRVFIVIDFLTYTMYHLTWEFQKIFIIYVITLHFIDPKINELAIF